jgi:putative transposase
MSKVPSRLVRLQETGHSHFITFSCHGRNPYLSSPEAKTVLQGVIEKIRNRYRFHIFGYVIMPEHVHLLLSEPELKPLNVALAVIKREVSSLLVEKPLWLPRYYDFNIFTNAKSMEKLRYIHRNPVTRGLAKRPEDYPWSSFRAYALLESNPVTITRTV